MEHMYCSNYHDDDGDDDNGNDGYADDDGDEDKRDNHDDLITNEIFPWLWTWDY